MISKHNRLKIKKIVGHVFNVTFLGKNASRYKRNLNAVKFLTAFMAVLFAAALGVLIISPSSANDTDNEIPWPPFWFDLTPTYADGKITYQANVFSRVDTQLVDLVIKIPVPEGTRFADAHTLSETGVQFDGQEVTLFFSTLDQYTEDNWITFEVTDPARTIFTTQSWLSWKGELGGDYLADPVSFDISRQTLNWQPPGRSRLQLGVEATVINNTITYLIYPKAVDKERMWDVNIKIPLPDGLTLLDTNAPSPFSVRVENNQVIIFSIPELARQIEHGPLAFTVANNSADSPLVVPIWSTWTNGPRDPIPNQIMKQGRRDAGPEIAPPIAPATEITLTNTILNRPYLWQHTIFDLTEDVPFAHYDLTGITFEDVDATTLATFNTLDALGSIGLPLRFTLYIDNDCDNTTGQTVQNRGADFLARYSHASGNAFLIPWSTQINDWDWDAGIDLESLAIENAVTISIPHNAAQISQQFCWIAAADNETEEFNPNPPTDWIPNEEFSALTKHIINVSAPGITGKIAIPIKDNPYFYDTYIFSMPDGGELVKIPNTHQPNFNRTGQKLLANNQSSDAQQEYEYDLNDERKVALTIKSSATSEGLHEYNLIDESNRPIIAAQEAAFPFYNPQENQMAYSIAVTNTGVSTNTLNAALQSGYVVQCTMPISGSTEQNCQNVSTLGTDSSYPVWVGNNSVAYRGCSDEGCGIYLTNNDSAKTVQLIKNNSALPADAQGTLITFTSQEEGNWEAYVMNADGTGVRNLSNAPNANNGLPTISPDGHWIAFVSDRDGSWGVWRVPVTGGPATKLFALPADISWNGDDDSWINERISWGP